MHGTRVARPTLGRRVAEGTPTSREVLQPGKCPAQRQGITLNACQRRKARCELAYITDVCLAHE